MAFIDVVKQWFQTGDKPTQEQFWQLFEWLRWKDEAITVDATNLVTNTVFEAHVQGERISYNADAAYPIPAGYLLEKVIILPGVAANISIGSAAGADDIAPAITMQPDGEVVELNLYTAGGRTVHFNGIPVNSAIIYFKRFVKTA